MDVVNEEWYTNVGWRVRGIRGATTADANTYEAIEAAVLELMDQIESENAIDPMEIVSVTFSVTADLDVVFPAKIARSRPQWEYVPLMDIQHMAVQGSLAKCIRVLMHVNTPLSQREVHHVYLRGAQQLRPDLLVHQPSVSV
ncbi:MAG: chorismate mutase [Pseudanabaena sp. ELA607]